MGDKLEGFVADHRPEFDRHFDREKRLWQKIDNELDNGKPNFNWIWKVAAVLFLASTVWLTVDRLKSDDEKITIVDDRLEEFQKAESFYTQLIMEKRSQISTYSNEKLILEFEGDLKHLDGLYDELRATFDQTGNDDQ